MLRCRLYGDYLSGTVLQIPTTAFLCISLIKRSLGASGWIAFVKAHQKKHGGSYSASMKAAAPLWRKQKAGKGAAKADKADKGDDDGKKKSKKDGEEKSKV